MHFYTVTTQFYLGIFLSATTAFLGKWIGDRITAAPARRLAYHDRIRDELKCQSDCEKLVQHIDDIEVIAAKLFKRYHAGEKFIFEMESLEIEIAQRPKIKVGE